MADATRFKDVLEAQKQMDQMLKSEGLRRDAAEAKMQEQIVEMGLGMDSKLQGIEDKYVNLTNTLASIQLQLSNMSKGKSHVEVESILGEPVSANKQISNYSRSQYNTQDGWSSGRNDNNQGNQFKKSQPKIDFPRFDGCNPRSWFLRCNHYFKMVPEMSDSYKIHMACMNLEGKAAQWYQNVDMGEVDLTWNQFVGIISARFEDIKGAKIIAEFNKLKQTGSYDDYVEKFEELKACMLLFNRSQYDEEHFMASFVSGVSEDMQAAIDLADPKTLKQTIEVGKKHILTMDAITRRLKGSNRWGTLSQQYRRDDTALNPTKTGPNVYQKAPIRLLTSAEMTARREKGLCFNCDEKFVQGHRCKNVMKCMMMNEQDELCHFQKLKEVAVEYEQEFEEPMEEIPIALNTINGLGGVSILKLLGDCKGEKLKILVDSGSTVSFIQHSTAVKLGCKLLPAKAVRVRVAGGLGLLCNQKVEKLQWMVQGHQFEYSLRVLEDLGCDMILGCDWVNLMSPVEFDLPNKTITVSRNDEKLKMQGITTISEECNIISGPALFHLLHTELQTEVEEIFLLHIQPIMPSPDLALNALLEQYQDVFDEPTELPPSRGVEHQILLKPGSVPKHQFPYRTSHNHKGEIERIVKELLDAGLIQNSKSPFASPVILVKKKDNMWRMCVDYRYLNSLTIKHEYPIPIIDELLEELHGAKFFSKIDLRSGYFQILMKPEDRFYTAFSTHQGHYEFIVMPFGLCNAPATFQSLMNQTFRDYLRKFVLVFFDDILIYSTTMADHLLHVQKVLELLRQNKLFAKRSKCSFGQGKIEYLGHIISDEGVSTDPEKISCMLQWPKPKNVKQLRGFLGLTGYYRKFVKNYGIISKPLTDLLKKDGFQWSTTAELAFHQLKQAMTTSPVLALPDFSTEFIVETDASGKGIGAVLMQNGRPIAFLSKGLCPRNQALSIYEREFLAVLMAIQKWRCYLQGHKFIIKTDQQALKYLLDQKTLSPIQQRGFTKLVGLNYEIQFKKGVDNKVADALSRCHFEDVQCAAMTTLIPVWIQKVQASYATDKFFSKVLAAKVMDSSAYPDFQLDGGLLRYKGRLAIGDHQDLRYSILTEMHGSAFGGHSGILGTYMRTKSIFYWPQMKGQIEGLVQSCDVCQRTKKDQGPYPGLLQPLPIPNEAWTHVSMDFIEGLPHSNGKSVILVIIDRFTKYGHFVALSHPYTAQSIAKTFLDVVYRLHGQPVSIVTDRDVVFTSSFWKELFKLMGVQLAMSSAYHPQSDGQTERLNQCLENYLRAMVHSCPRKWSVWIPLAEYWYNTNFHSGLKLTPFQALYGYKPTHLSTGPYVESTVQDVQDFLQSRAQIISLLKENLHTAQDRMKKFADLKRSDRSFQVGDFVYLKLQPFRQNSVSLRRNLKLSAKFYGPYRVLERIGAVAYKLELPQSARIHPVFHVSLLKKCISSKIVPQLTLPAVDDGGDFNVAPASVLASRMITRSSQPTPQLLVLWTNSDEHAATWEDSSFIRRKFRTFDPWGQGSSVAGGIVTDIADGGQALATVE